MQLKLFWISCRVNKEYCWNLLWSKWLDWCGLTAEGDLLSLLRKLFQTACFQVLQVLYSKSSVPLHGAKETRKAASVTTEYLGSCGWQSYFYLTFNYLVFQVDDSPVATCYSEWHFLSLALLHCRCTAHPSFLIALRSLFFSWLWRINLRSSCGRSLYCEFFHMLTGAV